MSAATTTLRTDAPSDTIPQGPQAKAQGTRETVESIIVAFILAFLFRAFVAEAFVIPTGSMAPTLMGAHKDLFCQHCGQQYQASASSEFVSSTQAPSPYVTVASTCATCRGLNAYDFKGNSNHATFSGDRILVSKFDYVFQNPQRWEVLVFKYPIEAHMNYIKRLIGLPGESLLIQEGDIYTRTDAAQPYTIARKPPHKIRAMRQLVADTKFQPREIIERGWPSLWQSPAAEAESSWKVQQSPTQWNAELSAGPQPQWLRYYHKFLDDVSWQTALAGGELPAIDPHSSTLITDYLAYNSSYQWNRSSFYRGGKLLPEVSQEKTALDIAVDEGLQLGSGQGSDNDGQHWVGDLAGDFDVEVLSDSGTLLLDLVEFGIHFRCAIDVASGQAKLTAHSDVPMSGFLAGVDELTAQTPLRGAGKYRVELANFDDQIVLWVNGKTLPFDRPAEFDSHAVRAAANQRRPYWTQQDPLDAAPVAVGGQEIQMKVNRARVYRDIYYIAVQGGGFGATQYCDYNLDRLGPLLAAIPDSSVRNQMRSPLDVIAAVHAHPQWWDQSNLFAQRGQLGFELESEQYFPMGDNSSHSSDARAWVGHNFVEQKFLLGKALMVFWPHMWNTPVPFTPNFARMGLIR